MNKDPIIDTRRSSRPYLLLTGATGLVGRYLLRNLFLQGRQIAVVVRPHRRLSGKQRIENILQAWESELGHQLPRPIVFEGDVAKPDLGLAADELLWIRDHCDQLIHSAAILQFHGSSLSDEPWRTNLGGTRNVLNLSRVCEIDELHYISTAYVCGVRDQLVRETELDTGQEFRNDYERSKFEAEKLVAAAEHFRSKTVYRPAVIVGDSKSGFTSTYHGLFLYLRLLAMLVPQQKRNSKGVIETPIRLPMDGEESRNLVPVDWVADVISEIFCNPDAHGRTYHLSPDKCTTPREVIEHCYEYFNSTGVEFCGTQASREGHNDFARNYFANVGVYEAYETSDPKFDKSNLLKFAPIPCPEIDKAMTLRFMEFGKANRWGKQKATAPRVDRWFETQLVNIAKSAATVLEKLATRGPICKFGLDIHGPGGGQWQLTSGPDGEFHFAPGLPGQSYPVLTMDDQQVNELLDSASRRSADNGVGCPSQLWFDSIESVLTPTTGSL